MRRKCDGLTLNGSGFKRKLQRLLCKYREGNCRVATDLENSGNSENCQNLRENSRKFEFLWKRPQKTQGKLWKTQGKWNYMTWSPTKMHSIEFSSLELLWGKILKCPGKLREFCFSKLWPPWTAIVFKPSYLQRTHFRFVKFRNKRAIFLAH